MSLSPINSQLANMEYMLYGGASGLNSSVPSMYNGYRANFSNSNPYFMGGYNPALGGYYNPSVFTNPKAAAAAAGLGTAAAGAGATAVGVSEKDLDVLADYASKINEEGETFLGACTGGLTFAAFENMQNVKHWKNAWIGMKKADEMFNLNKELWKTQPELMQNAYSQAQAAYRRLQEKKGLSGMFAKQVTGKDAEIVNKLLDDLKNAVKHGNKDEIIRITHELKDARAIDGYITKPWNAVTGKKNFTVEQRLNNKKEARLKSIDEAKNALKTGESWFTGAKFMKEFKPWFFFELAIEGLTKVLPTYMEGGADSGNKQLVQSGFKAGASAAGWAVGRLAGGWLGTKIGAAVGSAICPGVGTAVGAIIGFAGGCVGSWLAGKGLKSIMGKDESEKLAEAKMKKTQEGQAQLLQLAYQKAQAGEAPQEVVNSLNNIVRQVA